MSNLLSNKHNIFGRLGDFWANQLSESPSGGVALAKTFSHILDGTSAVGELNSAMARLAGEFSTLKNNITIKFNPLNVSVINLNLNERSLTGTYPTFTITRTGKHSLTNSGFLQVENLSNTGGIPLTANYSEVLADNDTGGIIYNFNDRTIILDTNESRPLFYVPIPANISPVCIATKTNELTVATSFTTHPGYILFYDSPYDLFPDNQIVCRSAYVKQSHIFDYTYQADNMYSAGSYMAKYMRATHSAPALRLAIAEIANLPIIKETSILEAYYATVDSYIYEFDTCVLKVPAYIDHTVLTVGTTYDAGTIIGEDYVKVYSESNADYTPWYRTTDLQDTWTANGLDISSITSFSVVKLTDTTGTFSNNGTQSSPTAHLKISGLTGSSTGDYWSFVRQSEIHTNKYIANISGVTAGSTANVIDFYFNNMLSYNSVIIKLRTRELGAEIHDNVMSFINRDLPINLTPIIIQ